jgi:hypothetical protein
MLPVRNYDNISFSVSERYKQLGIDVHFLISCNRVDKI